MYNIPLHHMKRKTHQVTRCEPDVEKNLLHFLIDSVIESHKSDLVGWTALLFSWRSAICLTHRDGVGRRMVSQWCAWNNTIDVCVGIQQRISKINSNQSRILESTTNELFVRVLHLNFISRFVRVPSYAMLPWMSLATHIACCRCQCYPRTHVGWCYLSRT